MKSLRLSALVAGLGLLAGGCATVTTGTTQAINVDSEPREADCTLTRDGVDLGSVKTPGPITIRRHASTIHVTCRKEGHEDSRVVMNARFETASAGNFLLGGVVGVIVDAASGANSRYDPYVMVRLPAMSAADQAAAASRPKPMPNAVPIVPIPTAASPAPAAMPGPPPASAGPFDGDYNGDFQVDVSIPSEQHRRVEIAVIGGKGTGRVLANRCPPGPVALSIDSGGVVSGEMEVPDRSDCSPLKAVITGKVVGGSLVVVANPAGRKSIEMTLSRKGTPAVAIDPKFNGEYVGSVDMPGASNSRPIRIRFVNGRGAGQADRSQCSRSGTIELVVSEEGKVGGEGSLVGDTSCGLVPVKVSGQTEGNNLRLTFVSSGGSREFVFDRR